MNPDKITFIEMAPGQRLHQFDLTPIASSMTAVLLLQGTRWNDEDNDSEPEYRNAEEPPSSGTRTPGNMSLERASKGTP
eukprot:9151325-Heterocapsa_arctica.AAC.1